MYTPTPYETQHQCIHQRRITTNNPTPCQIQAPSRVHRSTYVCVTALLGHDRDILRVALDRPRLLQRQHLDDAVAQRLRDRAFGR